MSRDEPFLLLDALSDRVLRTLPPSAWRKLFLRPHGEAIRLAPARGTLLCALDASDGWGGGSGVRSELAFLATCHGGELDDCPPGTALLHFPTAESALEMALAMQQLAWDARFQLALVSGEFTVADIQTEQGELRVLIGDTVDRAHAMTRLAAPGSIRIAPETFAQVEQRVDSASCLITTEFEGECISAVSMILPPRSTAHLSTFAGLGLT